MSQRRGLLAEVSWFQVAASVLAAVTAAWIASRLGVAGTLIGVAVGSFVATISSAFYGHTLDKGRTLLVQTAAGTIIQKTVQDGEIADALDEAAEVDHSPVQRAEIIQTDTRRLHWKTIIVTSIAVLALSLGAISAYELVTGTTLDGSNGTTVGDTFGGSKGKSDPKPTPDETTPTPGPTTTTSTPTPEPSDSTPTPDPSPPTPTPSDTPTEPVE